MWTMFMTSLYIFTMMTKLDSTWISDLNLVRMTAVLKYDNSCARDRDDTTAPGRHS